LSGPEPFFLDGAAGPLFCVFFPAQQRSRRAALVLPPFAEEMNKSRRMLALAARALQKAGLDSLLVDLYGTGDSGGDFADATLAVWRSDLQAASRWLASRGTTRLDVIAVRGGALLLQDFEPPAGLERGRGVLWQPVVNGKVLVAQFLRLRLAEGMGDADRTGTTSDTRALLQASGRIEVAGYEVTRELVCELEDVTDALAGADAWQSLSWFEIVADGVTGPGPAAQRALDALRQRGVRVQSATVPGEPFWGTPEIAVVPGLVDATVAALAETDA
jgi:exosortase A-associated hydrolase 2